MAQLAENSETEVANLALSHIKKPRITSIDDDRSNTANVLRLHFASVRDALQRQYPWNFCEDFASLNAVADSAPLFGFARYFELPPDCLWVREVKGCGSNEWRVMGRRIATNADAPLKIRFTKRTPQVPIWDALFKVVFPMHLAVAIAAELSTDEKIASVVAEKAGEMLEQAYPSDAAESGDVALPQTDWVSCR
jgi:hypothetical protein